MGINLDNLNTMAAELSCILQDDTSKDEDYLAPTAYAIETAKQVLSESRFDGNYPLGDVCADGDGGIRIDWQNGDSYVSLVIPSKSTGKQYIFWQFGSDYSGTYDISGAALRNQLEQLTDGHLPTP